MALQDIPEDKPIAVPAYSSSGIFGSDVDEVRQQIAMQQQNNAMQFANMPRGRGPVYAAALAGQQLGGALETAAGYQDPRVKKAQQLEEAAKEVDSQGYSLLKDPNEYYTAAYNSLTKRGMYAEAAKVHDIMVQQQVAQAEAQAKQLTAAKGRFVYKNGVLIDSVTGTGQKIAGGERSQIVSIGDPGLKPGSPGIKSYDMTDPDQRAAAYEDLKAGKIAYGEPTNPVQFSATVEATKNFDKTAQAAVLKPALEDVSKSGISADHAIPTLDFLIGQLERPDLKFEPGTLSGLRSNIGNVLDYAGLGFVADAIKANPTDAQLMNTAVAQLIAHSAASMGSKQLTAKNIQLAELQSPELGMTKTGMYVAARMQKEQMEYNKRVYDYMTSLFANPEYGPEKDPTGANVAHAISKWKAEHPLDYSPETISKLESAINLKKLVAKAQPVQRYYDPRSGQLSEGGLSQDKPYKYNGMLVRWTGKYIPSQEDSTKKLPELVPWEQTGNK